ncbi:hypothetical protein Pla163_03670 [Planctomycetes bacterium Pla163]|uniref:Uncharacterized protein n=1 Tax=Rohdeia mirabilis TaxID=2528008 RepID=A0A518CVL6_9BACT|nr:hypothetical protein Pla163_03670 [Planctomycetes bacterium Pla163]
MTRNLLTRLGTGAALTTAATLALFTFDASPLDAAPAPPMQVLGATFGLWDLPQDVGSLGVASGTIADASGATVFELKVSLEEIQSPALALRFGTIDGLLDDGSGLAWPRYEVSGDWTASSLIGRGSFKGTISRQVSPHGPTIPIGTIGGRFRDFPLFPNQDGAFAGRWQATL